MHMFTESFKYPIKSDNFIKATLITIASTIIFPLIPLTLGFYMKVIRHSKDNQPFPSYDNFKKLYIDGLKLIAVLLGLTIALSLIFSIVGAGLGALIAGEAVQIAVSLLYSIVLIYLTPAVVYKFAQNSSIRQAFDVEGLIDLLTTKAYVKVLLVLLAANLLITLAQLVLVLTLVGIVLVLFTIPYEYFVYSTILAEIEEAEQ